MYSLLSLLDRTDKTVTLKEQARRIVALWGDNMEATLLKKVDHEQRLHQEVSN